MYFTDVTHGLFDWYRERDAIVDHDVQNNRIPDVEEGLFDYPNGIPFSTCKYCKNLTINILQKKQL